MSTDSSRWPQVRFAVRFPAGSGTWRYEHISVANPGGQDVIALEYPPAIGDLISVWDSDRARRQLPQPEGGPMYRVLDRWWTHSSWGSADWPYGEQMPRSGPLLEIILEPAEGLYRNEAPVCADLECEARFLFGQWQLPPGTEAAPPHDHRPYKRA